MARIRSVHPSLFTDEAFMSASPYARLLIIGLWCEAFDDGVFDWKPLTLKARIFPVDSVFVPDLLAELEGLGFLKAFQSGGRQFGAIRNFQRFQRPKKPNSSRVLPPELEQYVGQHSGNPEPKGNESGSGSAPVRKQFGTDGGKPPQMEDGGGRMSSSEAKASAPLAVVSKDPQAELFERGKAVLGDDAGSLIAKLLKAKNRIVPHARAAIEEASTKQNPREYIARVIRGPPAQNFEVGRVSVAI